MQSTINAPARMKGFMLSLFGGLLAEKTGPGLALTREPMPQASHADVGRPRARANNPLLAGVAYIYRQDQWAPYFVATSGILNIQSLFNLIPGNSYTPSGGAALTITNWHTSMRQGGLLSNPDMFNCLYMSLSVRGDTFATDLNRFLSDALVTLYIGNETPYGLSHAYRVPAAGGGYGASSAIVSNGFPQIANQYEMEASYMDGQPTLDANGQPTGSVNEIFPGSGWAGNKGELVTQQQRLSVNINPTLVADANGNTTYTCSGSGTGLTAFVVLRGQYSRAVQG